MKFALGLIFAVLVYPCAAQAQTSLRLPQNLDAVEVYLHTVDVGTRIYDNYGHTQIRIRDPEGGTDMAFSWGLFDFDDPGFLLKFYKGILRYRIGAFRLDQAHTIYRWEGRTVWEDRLNLSSPQKARLLEKIFWQLQPENREYDYQYFFDNCSTRPRDFLDFAISGGLKSRFEYELSESTFRDAVREHQATVPLTGLGLEVVMNSRLDRPMTRWEEMFLPKSLRQYLLSMPQIDEQGQSIAGTQLMQPLKTMYESPTPHADYRRDGFLAYWLFAGASFIVGLAHWWRHRKDRHANLGRAAFRLLGAGSMLWGFLAGIFGTLMIVSWAWSQHLDLHHNANLWLFWPLDFALILPGAAWLWRGRPIDSPRWVRYLKHLLLAHAIGLAVLLLLTLFGASEQNVSRVVAIFGGIMLLNYTVAWRIGCRAKTE